MTTFQKVVIFLIAVIALASGIFQAYSFYNSCKTGLGKYRVEATTK